MKNIYLFAVIFAVLVFSACSNGDDDSESDSNNPSSSSKGDVGSGSKSGVCYFPNAMENENVGFELGMCTEGKTKPLTSADCERAAISTNATVNFQNSCPSEYKLKCDAEDGYVYLYGEAIVSLGFNCSTFGWESTSPSSSSNGGSKPSSSSNGGSKPSSSSAGSSKSSSDSNSGSKACYVKFPNMDLAGCLEGKTESITSSECKDAEDDGMLVNFLNSCPSGYELECEAEEGKAYYYGAAVKVLGFTCEDLLDEE